MATHLTTIAIRNNMPTDYIKAADLHTALARVRDETKAKVWAEAYAAGRKDEADQYAKAIQLVTLGRAMAGLGPVPAVVTQQFPVGDSEVKARPEGADYSVHNDTIAAREATHSAYNAAMATDNPNRGMLEATRGDVDKLRIPTAAWHQSVAKNLHRMAEHHEEEAYYWPPEEGAEDPAHNAHVLAATRLRSAAKAHERAARRYMTEREEYGSEAKAFADNPALPRRENPDGPAYGKLLQLPEGWVHPDGAVTPLTHAGEAHVSALAEADPGVSQAFHASLARHAHRKHPGEFVDDDVKDYAFDKGFIHLTGRGRTIEATGKHEMLLKHRKFLKELAMRATTLVFRPVDGDDYEVKARADRERKSIPADSHGRTEHVMGTHYALEENPHHTLARHMHADALSDDAGEDGLAAVHHYVASVGMHDEDYWRDNLVHQFGGNASRAAQAVTRHAVEHLNALHPDANTDNTPDWHVSAYLDGRQAHRAADEAVAGAPPFLYRDQSGNFKPTPETNPVRLERFRTSRHADARHYHQSVVRAAEHPESIYLDHYDNAGQETQPPPQPPMTAPEHLQHVALLHHAAAEMHRYAATTPPVETKAIPANPRHRTEAVIGTHHAIHDALARGDTGRANYMRQINADALDDAGAVRESTLERVLSGAAPPAALAATFKNAANLKRAARSRTEAAHTATEAVLSRGVQPDAADANDRDEQFSDFANDAFDASHGSRWSARLGEHRDASEQHRMAADRHEWAAGDYTEMGDVNSSFPEFHEIAALHRHAAEQHRVAAAYNAAAHHADSQRIVKAVRWNQARAEQHEPHVTDGNYAGDYDEDDAGSEPVHSAYYRSNALLDKSGDAGHVDKLADRYPHLNPRQTAENMLDAADLGDEAGHRYWKRRLGDVHLMLAGEAATAGDHDLSAEHDKLASHLHGTSHTLDEEYETAAHLIAHHKGDVAAAARHASEAAIKATDPDTLKTARRGGQIEPISFDTKLTGGQDYYIGRMYNHTDAAHAIRNAPDTYRPLTADDITRHEAGTHTGGFYRPAERGDQQYFFTSPRGVVSRDPTDPTKFSLATSNAGTIDHENVNTYHTIDMDARQHRLDVQQMHEVAALLHREAATGDHEKREVKAEVSSPSPGIAPWSLSPAELVKSGVRFFRTGQGSTYALHPSGPTIRVKTPHAGHVSTDHGIKQGSERTVYVAGEDARRIGMWGSASSTSKRLSLANADEHGGHLLLTSVGASGSRGKDGEPIKFHSTPALGLSPLELFNRRTESFAGPDAEHYGSSHPGSPITQLDVPHDEGHQILTAAARAAGKKNVYTPKPPTVKAFAPGIEAEPGAAGRTLHPTAGHPAADNNEAALHAAMLVQPHDMTPRMVLADYYDDHDQPHTAALHRFVAEPTRANFDTLAAFHEHPSEVAHTVEHAAATHADATIPRWVNVDRGITYEDERRHPATGAIPPTGLRNELNNVIHRNAYHPSVQRFPADSPSRTERRLTRDSLMWHHQQYGEEQANFAAAHADPSTVADWGPDPISEQGHAFARTLHHAAAEAHRHARDYLTEQDALDKPERNDGPIPEGVWRHPRLGREGKAVADSPEGTPLHKKLTELRPHFAAAAQAEYESWNPDHDEYGDPEVGGGGICDAVADSMADVCREHGINAFTRNSEGMGENHTWMIAHDKDHLYHVDIHPHHYETGGGYSWQKRKGVKLTGDHVDIMGGNHADFADEIGDDYAEDEHKAYTGDITTRGRV